MKIITQRTRTAIVHQCRDLAAGLGFGFRQVHEDDPQGGRIAYEITLGDGRVRKMAPGRCRDELANLDQLRRRSLASS